MGVSLPTLMMIALLSFPSLASSWCGGGSGIPVGIGGVGIIGGVVVLRPPPSMMMKSRLLSSHENNYCCDSIISRHSSRHPPSRLDCNVVRSSPRRDRRRPNIAVFELRSRAKNDDDVDVDVDGGGGAKTTTTDDGGTTTGDDDDDDQEEEQKMTLERASKLLSTFWSMAFPYYEESKPGRRLFYGMIFLTLVNSSVSVAFSYVSKDFWNALSSKDVAEFYAMMIKFGGALVVGAPVSVLYR